jgi:hypothetical protein
VDARGVRFAFGGFILATCALVAWGVWPGATSRPTHVDGAPAFAPATKSAPNPSEQTIAPGAVGPTLRASAVSGPTDDALMTAMREQVDVDPASTLAAVDLADARFPASAYREERRFLAIRAQVHLERIGAARTDAEAFYRMFPRSSFREDVERLTGMHPPPPPPW